MDLYIFIRIVRKKSSFLFGGYGGLIFGRLQTSGQLCRKLSGLEKKPGGVPCTHFLSADQSPFAGQVPCWAFLPVPVLIGQLTFEIHRVNGMSNPYLPASAQGSL